MISKELLSEVTDDNVIRIDDFPNEYTNDLLYTQTNESRPYTESINIYELAYKCKEWAFEQGYTIKSYKSNEDWWASSFNHYTNAVAEPEAVIEHCEWILEQKDNL